MDAYREPKWADVVVQIDKELGTLARRLEEIQPEATTNQLRGEIRALRRLRTFGEPLTPPDPHKMIQPATPGPFE